MKAPKITYKYVLNQNFCYEDEQLRTLRTLYVGHVIWTLPDLFDKAVEYSANVGRGMTIDVPRMFVDIIEVRTTEKKVG